MYKLLLSGALAAIAALTTTAAAQDWPTKPITLIVPFAAGGANDLIARLLVPHMSEALGQQVVVENAPGAGGRLAMAKVAKTAPDGYTVGMGSAPTQVYSQLLFKKPPFDAVADFEAVALLAVQPLVLAARRDLPPNNLKEFIAYAKANGKKMQYGSAGVGSATHLACMLLNHTAGIDIVHVPYKGGAPVMNDLLAGRIDYWCGISTTAMPHINADKVKAIATLAPDRLPILPGVATAHEQGLTDFDASSWAGLFYPNGTPAPIVNKFNAATVKAMDVPEVRERLGKLGATIVAPARRSPQYLTQFIQDEIKKWGGPIKAAGLSLD
jgi:tripartite-type tricarboxylate transporter receptor subunit TctC